MKLPIYLDYHSTTPVDPRVLKVMLPYFTEEFGNPSSKSHSFGWKAEHAVENARAQVAKLFGCQCGEIVFTGGATESNNFALLGIAEKYSDKGKHIITTSIEHKCILDTTKYLEKKGFRITYLPVNHFGQVVLSDLEKAIQSDTILISVMFANNETGSINPVKEIGALARSKGIFFHTDAAQAAGKIPIDVNHMNIDALSLSAHKMYGPKGIGAIFLRRKEPRVEVEPLLHGGGQERGLRSGTLNVPGIVGLGKACEIALEDMQEEAKRITGFRDFLQKKLTENLGALPLNGHPTQRLPQSLNISFPHVESDSIVANCKNIAVSSTSACMSAASIPSYVLAAMGVPKDLIHSSIRFGIGRFTSQEEIEYTIDTVSKVVKSLQLNSPLYQMSQTAMKGGGV